MHPRRSFIAPLIGAALAILVLVVRWQLGGERAPAPAPRDVPTTVPDATTDTTIPSVPRGKGSGLFGEPLAHRDKEAVRDEDADDEDEDLPLPTAPGAHPHILRRERKEKGTERHGDRHAIFSADVANPYPTPAQSTLDDLAGLDGMTGTVALWLQPLWLENSQDDATLVQFGDERLRLIKNVSFLRFEIVDRLGNQVGVGAPIGTWQAGEWHHIAATWDGRVIALYLDGVQIMAKGQSAAIDLPPGTPVYIGSAFPVGRPVAPAIMGGVTIRDRALTPMAVLRRFSAGPPVAP